MNSKLIFLGAAVVLLALALGYTFSAALAQVNFALVFWFLLFAALLLVALVLQTVFVDDQKAAAVLIAIETAALTGFFLFPFSYAPAFIGLAAFVLFFYAYKLGRNQLKNNLRISFIEIRGHALPLLSLTLASFLIGNYVVSLSGQQPITVSREAVAIMIRPLAPLLTPLVPGFNERLSIGEFLENFSIKVYGPQIDSRFTAEQLVGSINQLASVTLTFRENIIDAAYEIINSLLAGATPNQQRSLVFIWATFVFFLVGGGLYFINFVVALLAWLVYKLLLLVGFGYIIREKTEKEVIKLETYNL